MTASFNCRFAADTSILMRASWQAVIFLYRSTRLSVTSSNSGRLLRYAKSAIECRDFRANSLKPSFWIAATCLNWPFKSFFR